MFQLDGPAASIWLKSGAGRGSGSTNFDFPRQISEKFRFLQAIYPQIRFFQAEIGHLQLLLGKLFYFSSKVTTFKHASCTSKIYYYTTPLRQHDHPAQNLRAATPNPPGLTPLGWAHNSKTSRLSHRRSCPRDNQVDPSRRPKGGTTRYRRNWDTVSLEV